MRGHRPSESRTPMAPKPPASSSSGSISPPLWNALIVAGALGYGFWLLVDRGRVSWPPSDWLANLYTLAGCLALVGPLVLARRSASGGGLGEHLWLTAGLLVWIFDFAAVWRGQTQGLAWATPIRSQGLGLTLLAVLLAAWRTRGGGRDWSWANVTGWVLGVFWIALGLASLLPARSVGLAGR
jgi:hypothetical protein